MHRAWIVEGPAAAVLPPESQVSWPHILAVSDGRYDVRRPRWNMRIVPGRRTSAATYPHSARGAECQRRCDRCARCRRRCRPLPPCGVIVRPRVQARRSGAQEVATARWRASSSMLSAGAARLEPWSARCQLRTAAGRSRCPRSSAAVPVAGDPLRRNAERCSDRAVAWATCGRGSSGWPAESPDGRQRRRRNAPRMRQPLPAGRRGASSIPVRGPIQVRQRRSASSRTGTPRDVW